MALCRSKGLFQGFFRWDILGFITVQLPTSQQEEASRHRHHSRKHGNARELPRVVGFGKFQRHAHRKAVVENVYQDAGTTLRLL